MGHIPHTPIDSYPTIPCKDISKQKYNKCNCPNCGAPVNGPICEYCGSVLNNEEAEQTEYKIRQTQEQFARAKLAWEESVIQAELMRNLLQQSQQQINYNLQSQICCDTRTRINNGIIQSPDYIPNLAPIVIKQEQIEDSGFPIVAIIVAGIIFGILAAVLFVVFLA